MYNRFEAPRIKPLRLGELRDNFTGELISATWRGNVITITSLARTDIKPETLHVADYNWQLKANRFTPTEPLKRIGAI